MGSVAPFLASNDRFGRKRNRPENLYLCGWEGDCHSLAERVGLSPTSSGLCILASLGVCAGAQGSRTEVLIPPIGRCLDCVEQRRGWDSNPREAYASSGFQDRRIQPLCHLSKIRSCSPAAQKISVTSAVARSRCCSSKTNSGNLREGRRLSRMGRKSRLSWPTACCSDAFLYCCFRKT